MYTQGSRPSRIHGHMSQHTAKAPAVLKICLRHQVAVTYCPDRCKATCSRRQPNLLLVASYSIQPTHPQSLIGRQAATGAAEPPPQPPRRPAKPSRALPTLLRCSTLRRVNPSTSGDSPARRPPGTAFLDRCVKCIGRLHSNDGPIWYARSLADSTLVRPQGLPPVLAEAARPPEQSRPGHRAWGPPIHPTTHQAGHGWSLLWVALGRHCQKEPP
jgi:hypothetical protein